MILAYTGHRAADLGGYREHSEQNLRIRQDLLRLTETAVVTGYHCFISGMAQGVDQWAAEAVLELKQKYPYITLVAAVPFVMQHHIWPQSAQGVYFDILRRVDVIHLVDTEEVVSFEALQAKYEAQKAPERSYVARWLFARNAWMVDRCDTLFAVYREGKSGGTKNCVDYAIKKNVRVIRYDPDTHQTDLHHKAPRERELKKPL